MHKEPKSQMIRSHRNMCKDKTQNALQNSGELVAQHLPFQNFPCTSIIPINCNLVLAENS